MSDNTSIQFFVSYAHDNMVNAQDLVQRLLLRMNTSKHYNFGLWQDRAIVVGTDWHDDIQSAITHCQFGLLLVSYEFFNSGYISNDELPKFVGASASKQAIPVGLEIMDWNRTDMKGLDALQIYRYPKPPTLSPRFYAECRGIDKDRFADQLFDQIISRIDGIQAA
ncbi:MAG: toll/interleukin-1 receptor domain-containing protein [Methylococcales bacterium]